MMKATMCSLPPEIAEIIIDKLTISDLQNLQITCRYICAITRRLLWRNVRITVCGAAPSPQPQPPPDEPIADLHKRFKIVSMKYIFEVKKSISRGDIDPKWIRSLEVSTVRSHTSYSIWKLLPKLFNIRTKETFAAYYIQKVLAPRLTNLGELKIVTARTSQHSREGNQWASTARSLPRALLGCSSLKTVSLTFSLQHERIDREGFAKLPPQVETFKLKQYSRGYSKLLKEALARCTKLTTLHLECAFVKNTPDTCDWVPQTVTDLQLLYRNRERPETVPIIERPNVTRFATSLSNHQIPDEVYICLNTTHLEIHNTTKRPCLMARLSKSLVYRYFRNVTSLKLIDVCVEYRRILESFPYITVLSLINPGGKERSIPFLLALINDLGSRFGHQLNKLYLEFDHFRTIAFDMQNQQRQRNDGKNSMPLAKETVVGVTSRRDVPCQCVANWAELMIDCYHDGFDSISGKFFYRHVPSRPRLARKEH